jgi:hypothetical protein
MVDENSHIVTMSSSGGLVCAIGSGTARMETTKMTSSARFTLFIAGRLTSPCQLQCWNTLLLLMTSGQYVKSPYNIS